jgi:hypothetical protein
MNIHVNTDGDIIVFLKAALIGNFKNFKEAIIKIMMLSANI